MFSEEEAFEPRPKVYKDIILPWGGREVLAVKQKEP